MKPLLGSLIYIGQWPPPRIHGKSLLPGLPKVPRNVAHLQIPLFDAYSMALYAYYMVAEYKQNHRYGQAVKVYRGDPPAGR